ncbi:MAG: FtsX-like permease family protein, partial [Acidobacteriaceae bacterium]|nr:FtsX-like permease family protein [Acidobacteriaceae bacterium]
ISRAEAQADLTNIASELAREYPNADQGRTATATPMRDAISSPPVIFGSFGLLLVVGIVLLIACSNVANLLLARTSSRKQELSIRLAIGAGPGRVVRQALTESTVLALFGGLIGLGLGYEGCQLLWTLRPAEVAANFISPKLDLSVFVFAFLVSVATGLLFGVVPAVRASKTDVVEGLKRETRIAGSDRHSLAFSNALLAGQVALSLMSLIVAALFLRSIQRAYQIDPGFDSKHLAIFMMNPEQAGYDSARTKTFYRDLRNDLSERPGVTAASWASNLPFWANPSRALVIEDREQLKKSENPVTIVDMVDVDYFSTLGIPILEGRDFSERDSDGSTPVAVVNEYLAQKYWPGANALGRRFHFSDESADRQIIGVVKTTNYTGLGERPQACVYLPLRQNFVEGAILYVRSAADSYTIISAVRREIRNMAPNVEVTDIRTGQKIISQVLFIQNIGVGLLGVFGFLALALASVGLYGLLAYSVSQRQKEIGVRMAMGAESSSVLRLILGQGMKVVSFGLLIGLVLSVFVDRALSRMLVGISSHDPLSLAGALAVLIAVSVIACYLPARIASRIDPMAALRET